MKTFSVSEWSRRTKQNAWNKMHETMFIVKIKTVIWCHSLLTCSIWLCSQNEMESHNAISTCIEWRLVDAVNQLSPKNFTLLQIVAKSEILRWNLFYTVFQLVSIKFPVENWALVNHYYIMVWLCCSTNCTNTLKHFILRPRSPMFLQYMYAWQVVPSTTRKINNRH